MEIIWNGVSSTSIQGLVFTNPVRQVLGSHRGSFQEIPGRMGSWYYPQPRGRRSIKVAGFVLVDTFPDERRDALTALGDWLDVDVQAELILGDEPDVYYEAVLGDCGDMTEWRQSGTFELEWLVQPYSFETSVETIGISASNNYTTTFDPGIGTELPPIIEITPTNGTITGFVLALNDVNFYDPLGFTGLVASGDTIVVNSIAQVVTQGLSTDTELTGAYNSAQLSMAHIVGGFPRLMPGVNTFFFGTNGTATAITITIYYRRAYRR